MTSNGLILNVHNKPPYIGEVIRDNDKEKLSPTKGGITCPPKVDHPPLCNEVCAMMRMTM